MGDLGAPIVVNTLPLADDVLADVQEMPVQTAVPATPAAGSATEFFVNADGTAHYVTDDGQDHRLQEAVGLAKSFQVIGLSQVQPAENALLRSSTASSILYTADFVTARNFTERRPFTAVGVSISLDMSAATVGWKDIYYHVTAPMATATATALIATDTGVLPAVQDDDNYYAFLGTVRVTAPGTLRLFAMRANEVSAANTAVLANGADLPWTAIDLSGAVPPNAQRVDFQVELSVWAAQFTALRMATALATTTIGRRNFAISTRPLTSATFSDTDPGRFSVVTFTRMPLTVPQSMVYQLSAANSRATILVQGYTL
ncbi:MAG: hypothetical protein ACR2RL_21770 [Gammaproteobacteria bacterium]